MNNYNSQINNTTNLYYIKTIQFIIKLSFILGVDIIEVVCYSFSKAVSLRKGKGKKYL